jgi:hypothetical protein
MMMWVRYLVKKMEVTTRVKDRISGTMVDLKWKDRDEFSWYCEFELKDKKTSLIIYHKDMKRLVKSI